MNTSPLASGDTGTAQPGHDRDGFERFRDAVYLDSDLQQRLLGAKDLVELEQRIAHEAAQLGYTVSPAEIASHRALLRRDWMEQWLP